MVIGGLRDRVQSYQTLFVPGISLGPTLPKKIIHKSLTFCFSTVELNFKQVPNSVDDTEILTG